MNCPRCGSPMKHLDHRGDYIAEYDVYYCPKCDAKYLAVYDKYEQKTFIEPLE